MTTTFADLGVPDDIVGTLSRQGITEPFPIQAAVIRDALAGRDVSGRAPTGSGKTLAFGIPILTNVAKSTPNKPRALVLAPTRELAEQIRRELLPLGKTRRRFIGSVYGGVGYGPQIQSLRRGVDVLVACPGRLLDLIEQGHVDLSTVQMAVIDEADRMADMGFLPDVKRILDLTPRSRVTWLFSATLDGDVAVLRKRYQKDPVTHSVGSEFDDHSDARHYFWKVGAKERIAEAAAVIEAGGPAIVFCRTRRGVDRVARQLEQAGVSASSIHGGRSQSQRTRALKGFADGRVAALVATDVAARGIHVSGVETVIHFDPADDAKAYLHRSGRTARAGASGVVLSLVSEEVVGATKALQRSIGIDAPFTKPDTAQLSEGGFRIDPSVRPKPRTRPMKRPKNHSGKSGKGRGNRQRHQYYS